MLYLVQSDGLVQWCDMPGTRGVLDAATGDATVDLARLSWQPSERRDHDTLTELALRFGVPCSTGIVLDARRVAVLDHPRRIAETHAAAEAAHASVEATHGDALERLMPGRREDVRQLDRKVAEGSSRAYREAQQQADALFTTHEVDSSLVTHWLALGGSAPRAS